MSWWDDNHEKCSNKSVWCKWCKFIPCNSEKCFLNYYHDSIQQKLFVEGNCYSCRFYGKGKDKCESKYRCMLGSQWKPRPAKVKKWQWIYKNEHECYYLTGCKYSKEEIDSKKHVLNYFVEPYLPSEEEIDA